ncbi:2-succinyl-5-enolpyruvyl-6-hydroxy-3-cyclohexene-1-carboxylic-acid synthase [Herbiconiux sp.]|uniref:2-succinyl-5-enolpyruvyl-6-hydroxy-3- cyclohexene-1-carboxylic-acid synthase n=1 Tax=Herbiconiux sp. TaxID=1871186 RepID=UPI0025BD3C56|nr:2-succinyl-5-enolpyruvyl-6-hydroxy-3-cyclohexene-1-carboxylic-acid synthase [Herbiconiux sp.]
MTTPASAPSEGANASAAATFADRLVRALADLGVQHAVVSPGSRSQALALALAELETEGLVQVHVRIDERVGAFTALGIARETGVPALVVTTSGTAAANLLPAVVEASHSGVPMIVLTADRPEHLRGTGSNQTTYQPGLFGRFARWEADVPAPSLESIPDARRLAADAVAVSTGPDRGPVHLNLQFVEPLSGAVLPEDPESTGAPVEAGAGAGADADADAGAGAVAGAGAAAGAGAPTDAGAGAFVNSLGAGLAPERRTRHLPRGPRTLVVAGADAGERAQEIAAEAGWPLVAEVSSGARFGPQLAQHHRELLDHPDFGGRVERVVVLGHPTLSRQVSALLAREGLDLTVVREPGEPVVPHPDAVLVDDVTVDPEDRGDRAARAWTGQWVFAGRDLAEEAAAEDDVAPPVIVQGGSEDIEGSRAYAKGELAALNAPITRRALALAVWRATWPHDRLVLGASRLIRELDAAAPGKRIAVHANRGLAGIDGTVATATGIAIASQSVGAGVRARANAGANAGAGVARAARSSTARSSTARAGTTRVLLGDLTLLHDVGALLLPPGETAPRIQLVVGNDGGGSIFDGLEVAATAAPDAFDRVLFTPQQVDLAALAAAYGWTHRLLTRRGDLDSALSSPPPGRSIVEVRLAR